MALRLITGAAYGESSPVRTFSPMFYLAAEMPAGTALTLPAEYEERAVHVAEGAVSVAGQDLGVGRMAVFAAGAAVTLQAEEASRVMLLGGAPMDGPRHILVELRLLPIRADRAGEGGLAGGPLRRGAGRERVHPLAGGLTAADRRPAC